MIPLFDPWQNEHLTEHILDFSFVKKSLKSEQLCIAAVKGIEIQLFQTGKSDNLKIGTLGLWFVPPGSE